MRDKQGKPICVKITGTKKSQRYALRRLVISALELIQDEQPSFAVSITKLKTSARSCCSPRSWRLRRCWWKEEWFAKGVCLPGMKSCAG